MCSKCNRNNKNTADGFYFNPDNIAEDFIGTFITDPTKSPDGLLDVDPEAYYGCDYLNWRDRENNAKTSKFWTKTAVGNWYS